MHNSGLAFNMILQKIRYTPCSSGASWSVGLLRLRQVTFDFCNQSESNVRKTSDTTWGRNAQLIVFRHATALESFKTNVMFSASAQKAAFTKRKRRGAGPCALLRGGGG